MNGTEVGVLEKASEIALSRFLESDESLGLELERAIDTITDRSYEPLEGSFCKHEVCGLLILLNLSDSNCARTEPAFCLQTSLSRSRFLLCLDLASFRSTCNTGLTSHEWLLSGNFGSWHTSYETLNS